MKIKLKSFFDNKPFQNLLVYGVGQAFNLITPLLVVPFIVSKCGVENYGKTSIGMAISFFLIVFIDYGSDIIGVKEAAINRGDTEKLELLFITTISSKAILLAIVLVFVSILYYFVPFFSSEKTMFFLGIPILIAQFFNPTWFLQGIENFKLITVLTILSKIIYLIGIFFFITKKENYVLINLFWGIANLIAYGLVFLYVVKQQQFSFLKLRKEAVYSLIKSNFSLFSSQIFASLQMYAPIVFIGFLGSNFLAGQYKIIEQIILVFKTYILLFFNFVYPRVCFLLEKNNKAGLAFWKTYNFLNFLFILFSMVSIYVFSHVAVAYFSKTNIDETSNLLKIALFIPLLLAISIPLKQLLLGYNKQKIYVRTTMILVVINLVVIAIVLPYFKIYGVLGSLIMAEIVTIIIYYINIKDRLNHIEQ